MANLFNPEYQEILYPIADGVYRPLPYAVRGVSHTGALQVALGGVGMAPHHFLTQRGPFQDGSTPLDMRWDERTLELEITQAFRTRSDYWDRRWSLVDQLRPNRSFDIRRLAPQLLIFRHWMPGGRMQYGSDLQIEAGSNQVTSLSGRFVHWGLKAGETFTISGSIADDGNYTVVSVMNDFTVTLNAALTNDEAGVHFAYRRDYSLRDLYMLLDEGPDFNEPGEGILDHGYREVLRYTAHDPFWYGLEQSATWGIEGALGDLVFDLAGAWFGNTPGVGRWLFAPNYVGETVNVIYWGHEVSPPIIEVVGPAINPTIVNSTLGVTLVLSYTVAAGESVEIDTLNLTVVNNAGTNLAMFLSGDVANFGISPDPQAPGRINQIFISFGGGVVGQSSAVIKWRNKYVSL